MNTDTKLKILAVFELTLLSVVVTGLLALDQEKAVQFRLYEFIGFFISAVISTEGIRRMKVLTAD